MKKLLYLITIGFIALSCNSNRKNTDSSDGSITTSDIENYDCLQKYEEDYAALITKEEFASVYPFDVTNAEEDLQNQPSGYGYYTIQWDSGRPDKEMTISGVTIPVPDRDMMSVNRLSSASENKNMAEVKDFFDRGYKKLSDGELAEIDKNLDNASAEVGETGKKLMEARKNRNYDFIDGVGNSAWYRWNETTGGELAVLAGRRNFLIRTKVGEDPKENEKIAKQLAHIVLQKCK